MFLAGSRAEAQSLADRRVVAGFSGGVQFVKDAFMNAVDFELFQETGRFRASYDITTDTAFDGGIAYRVWKRLGVGVEVSHFYERTTASLEADVPHPFFFSFPRMTTGFAGGLTRREVGVHIQAQYWHVLGDDLLVRAFLGPTFFNVSHDLVSGIVTFEPGLDFNSERGLDEVDLVDHRSTKTSASAAGFNVGFDASYFGLRNLRFLGSSDVLDHFALAFVLRYSRGTAAIEINGGAQPALELGGTHIAGGVRVAF